MSELKSFESERIYWAVEQVERVAGDIDNLHLDDSQFYLKSEVDHYIAELEENHKKEVGQLLILNREQANAANRLRDSMEQALRHHKYKRCLAMAKWCEAESWQCCFCKGDFYAKWRNRWLKISEQFKEEK